MLWRFSDSMWICSAFSILMQYIVRRALLDGRHIHGFTRHNTTQPSATAFIISWLISDFVLIFKYQSSCMTFIYFQSNTLWLPPITLLSFLERLSLFFAGIHIVLFLITVAINRTWNFSWISSKWFIISSIFVQCDTSTQRSQVSQVHPM